MRARRNALISVQAVPSISGQDYLGSDKKAGGSGEWVLPGLISSLHHVVKDLELPCGPYHNEMGRGTRMIPSFTANAHVNEGQEPNSRKHY